MKRMLISLIAAMALTGSAWAADNSAAPPAPAAPPAAPAPAVQPVSVDSTYQIGIGDVLGISVWKDEALTKDVTVLPDGTISFPSWDS